MAQEAGARSLSSPPTPPIPRLSLCPKKGRICRSCLWLKQDRKAPWERTFSKRSEGQRRNLNQVLTSPWWRRWRDGDEVPSEVTISTRWLRLARKRRGKGEGVRGSGAGGMGPPPLSKGRYGKGWVWGSQHVCHMWMEEEGGSSRLCLSQCCNTPENAWPPLSLLLDCGLRREILLYLHTSLTHTAPELKCFKAYILEVTCLRKYSSRRLTELNYEVMR